MKKLFITLAIIAITWQTVYSQCTGGTADGALAAPTTSFQTAAFAGAGLYKTFNGTAGTYYVFSFCSGAGGSANYDTEITVLDNNGATLSNAYQDDFCGLNAELTWQAPSTNTYRVLVTRYNCQNTGGSAATLAYRQLPAINTITPASLPANFVSNTGFEARWTRTPGITNYRLDVSTSSTFASFVAGYDNRSLALSNISSEEVSFAVPGLQPSVTHYFRVRGELGGAPSSNSATQTATTVAHPALVAPFQWLAQASNTGGNFNKFNNMASDASGNIYAVGTFDSPTIVLGGTTLTRIGGLDIVLAKYNSAGVLQWVKVIGGAENDFGENIVTDGTGVYISGYYTGSMDADPNPGVFTLTNEGVNADDGFIARYNASDGSLVWAKSMEDAYAFTAGAGGKLALDGTGVYASGYFFNTSALGGTSTTYTSNGSADCFMAKYTTANGNIVWAKTFGGTGFDEVSASALAGGSYLVHGRSSGAVDYDPGAGVYSLDNGTAGGFLASYSTATGNFQWARNFAVTAGSAGQNFTSLALTTYSDQVYISGFLVGSTDLNPGAGTQTVSSGNYFRAGYLARYNLSDGSFVWGKGFEGTGFIRPTSLQADANGIYVGGTFSGSLDADPDAGQVMRTSNGSFDIFLARYNTSNGAIQWAKALGSTGDESTAAGIHLSGNGIYLCGTFAGSTNFDPYTGSQVVIPTGSGMFIVKYQSTTPPPVAPNMLAPEFVSNRGVLARFQGVADVRNYRFDMSADNFATFVFQNTPLTLSSPTTGVVGWNFFAFGTPGTTYKMRVRAEVDGAVSANSNEVSFTLASDPVETSANLWVDTFGGTGNEQTTALATDAAGNVYAVGYFGSNITIGSTNLTNAGGADAFMVKYNAAGAVQWAKALGSAANEEIWGVATDATGVYVYGFFNGPLDMDPNAGVQTLSIRAGTDYDGFLAKYDANGNYLWAVSLGDASPITGNPILSDGTGVYITGDFFGTNDFDPGAGTVSRTSNGDVDAFVARFAAATGALSWVNTFGGSGLDRGYALSLNAGGLYACGFYAQGADLDTGAGTNVPAQSGSYVIRFNASDGAHVWSKGILDGTGNVDNYALTTDASQVYLAGYFRGTVDFNPGGTARNVTAYNSDGFIASYNQSDGANVFARNLPSSNAIIPRKVMVNAAGIFVAGSSSWSGNFAPSPAEANRTSFVQDAFLANYALNGDFVYAKTFGGLENEVLRGGLALSTDGVYIGGSFRTTTNFNAYSGTLNRTSAGGDDAFIAKYTLAVAVPAAPVAAAASNITSGGFTANWSSVAGAASYRLDVSTSNVFSTFVTGYQNRTVNGTSFNVAGLAASITHYYRVRAVNSAGVSGNSGTITATTAAAALSTPGLPIVIANTPTTFTAGWTAVAGATYLLDVSADNFVSFVAGYNAKPVATTSEVVTGLVSNTAYQFRVRATNGTSFSAYTSPVATTTLLFAPTASPATAIAATSFTANWLARTGATSYKLDVSTSTTFSTFVTGFNNKIISSANVSDNVTGLAANTTYYYRVRAVNVTGDSPNSAIISVTTALAAPAAPVATAATGITANSFVANWNAVAGATGYFLDVSTVNTFATTLPNYNGLLVGGTSFTVTGLTGSTQYFYRLRATNSGGTSANSGTQSLTTLVPPAAPVATAASNISQTGFTANWNAVGGATSYRLDVSADNFTTFVAGFNNKTVSGTSDAISGLTVATSYKYRVRTVNANGTSANSNVIDVSTLPLGPAAPAALSATAITGTGFTANWSSVATATSYRLDVSLDNFASFIAGYNDRTVNGTSESVTGLSPGTLYKYRVRAVDGTGTSVNSNVMDVTTLPVPPVPLAQAASSVTSTGFTANWSTSAGATGYQLDISTDNFLSFLTGYNSKSVSGNSDVVTGLTAGTAYKYRVRAVNANGASGNSNAIDVTTTPKQNQTITFGVIAPKVLGSAPFDLTATASSNLPVTYTTTTPAKVTIAANKVTLTGAGRATITASQDGDVNFSAATPVSQTFCVNPAKPIITVTNANSELPTLTSSTTAGNQWFKDGLPISGAASASLLVTEPGSYTVRVTIETCASELSEAQSFIITGDITSSLGSSMLVYPNPARGIIRIQLGGFDAGEVQIALFDMLGREVQSASGIGQQEVSLDISGQPQGRYLLRAAQGNTLRHAQFVKE
jgi:hypothetical protein